MPYRIKKLYLKKMKGFLLADALIASFVLTTGLLAMTALISSSLRNSLDSRDAIVAVMLAQEGVELVRNIRDNNLAVGDPAFKDFPSSVDKTSCTFDYKNTATPNTKCTNSVGQLNKYYLVYDANGFYVHPSGAGSITKERYSRYLYIKYDDNATDDQKNATVRSFVYWGTSSFSPVDTGSTSGCTLASKCVFTEINLTSWK